MRGRDNRPGTDHLCWVAGTARRNRTPGRVLRPPFARETRPPRAVRRSLPSDAQRAGAQAAPHADAAYRAEEKRAESQATGCRDVPIRDENVLFAFRTTRAVHGPWQQK